MIVSLLRIVLRIVLLTWVMLGLMLPWPTAIPAQWADPPPTWISQALVPHLENATGGGLCGAVVFGDVLLTAEHCMMAPASTLVNYGTGPRTPLSVLCSARDEDFAMLRARIPLDSPRVNSGDSPAVGELVWVVGWPASTFTIRLLAVSYYMKNFRLGTTPPKVLPEVIVVLDAQVSKPGISGGVMFSRDGRLVGIMCCINETTQVAGAVPIRYGLEKCKL